MQFNMKLASLIAGALAAVAGAQDVTGFPQCAQWCINSMQQPNKSEELGCNGSDAACLCRNANFVYGVRDCSAELCANYTTAGQALNYANEFCRNQGVDLTSVTSGLPPQFTTVPAATGGAGAGAGAGGSQSAVTTSAIVSTIVSDGSTILSTVGSSTIPGGGAGAGSSASGTGSQAISTSAIVSTNTDGGSTVLSTLGSSTIFASPSAATSTTPIVSTVTSGSSTFETTVGSSTLTTTHAGTGTAGTTTTSSSTNYAPQMTAAPVGMLAAAGVAAFLL